MGMIRRDGYYTCYYCDKQHTQLWRHYNGANSERLYCKTCAIGTQVNAITEKLVGDQIGALVPAIPTELPNPYNWLLPTNATYWGYTSAPIGYIEWWKSLA